MRLQDRVAIVTGAGRGIGRAVAEKMAAQGARIVVADRDETLARETAADLNATPVVVDIGDPQSVEKLFSTVVQQFGGINILVNNAGVGIT
jgi:NAD(P)-dependent dehydrogenase (short-subunit alcohol dehydrogenase family)